MPTLPTLGQLYANFKAEVIYRVPALNNFGVGSNLDALAGASAALADSTTAICLDGVRSRVLSLAVGAEIDAFAADWYGSGKIPRKPATKATGTISVTRTTPSGNVTFTLGDVLRTISDGVTVDVEVTATTTILSTASSGTLPVQALLAGVDTNVVEGTSWEGVGITGSGNFSYTNLERLAGGSDEEEDGEYILRIQGWPEMQQAATARALELAAQTVPGVSFVTLDPSTMWDTAVPYLSLYVGDPDGAGNATLATQAATAAQAFAAAGDEVRGFPAAREEFDIALSVKLSRLDVDLATLESTIVENVLAYTNKIPAGRTYFASQAETAAHLADQTIVVSADQTSPTLREIVPNLSYNALRAVNVTVSFTRG